MFSTLSLLVGLTCCVLPAASASGERRWSTAGGQLLRGGSPVALHGLGSTCTEYLLRGVGMRCWVNYDWSNPAGVLGDLDMTQMDAIIGYLKQSEAPVVRIPMTASYWLGIRTNAAGGNFDKYPNLGGQYQSVIKNLVGNYTSNGVAVILDLHWNDDDGEQQPMALKQRQDGGPTGNALTFWDSVASTFGGNQDVFYELYNEPHISDINTYIHGDDTYAGMLEMAQVVQKHAPEAVLVIAGAADYAYGASSLLQLQPLLNGSNVMYNFHPYMGPAQSGDNQKCPSGLDQLLSQVARTGGPSILTEFGQSCCPTNGACESCPASGGVGYDEQVMQLAAKYNTSWMPWGWRPGANSGNAGCMDLNGGDAAGLTLVSNPKGGQGANFQALWTRYA